VSFSSIFASNGLTSLSTNHFSQITSQADIETITAHSFSKEIFQDSRKYKEKSSSQALNKNSHLFNINLLPNFLINWSK